MAKVFTSWKKIANYLGKGVRTVQRWEEECGLPVRRAQLGSHRAILAIPEELDTWISAQSSRERCELQDLRKENAALRKEVESLKQIINRRRVAFSNGALHSVSQCSSELFLQTQALAKYTAELVAQSRAYRLSPHVDVNSGSSKVN